jgi:hypothetical protein
MRKIRLNNKGFGLTEILIVTVVLVVVGGRAVYVYHRDHKIQAKSIDSSTIPLTGTTNKKSNTSTRTASPYAGWKTYCDSSNHYCFKYPSSWQLSNQSTAGQVYVTVTDSTTNTSVSYNNPDNDDAFPAAPFYTSLIYPLSGINSLTLIGGYWADQNGSNNDNEPFYAVIDSSYIKSYPLNVGETGHLSSNRFTDSGNNNQTASLILEGGQGANNNGQLPLSQVNTWLDSQTSRTGVLILKSFISN